MKSTIIKFSLFLLVIMLLFGYLSWYCRAEEFTPLSQPASVDNVAISHTNWLKWIEILAPIILALLGGKVGSLYSTKYGKLAVSTILVAKEIKKLASDEIGTIEEPNKETHDRLLENIAEAFKNSPDPTVEKWFKDNIINKHVDLK